MIVWHVVDGLRTFYLLVNPQELFEPIDQLLHEQQTILFEFTNPLDYVGYFCSFTYLLISDTISQRIAISIDMWVTFKPSYQFHTKRRLCNVSH